MVIIKWSKTMQNRAKVATISLPYLGISPLCPIKALVTMLTASGQDPDLPLFQVCRPAGQVPLTDSVARKHFTSFCCMLSLPKVLTFHDFRRGGHLGLQTWGAHTGYPCTEDMVFQCCLALHPAPPPLFCFLRLYLFPCSSFCLATSTGCLGSLVFTSLCKFADL